MSETPLLSFSEETTRCNRLFVNVEIGTLRYGEVHIHIIHRNSTHSSMERKTDMKKNSIEVKEKEVMIGFIALLIRSTSLPLSRTSDF
jgi:hypothetical protein